MSVSKQKAIEALEGLSNIAVHAIRRAGAGQRVDVTDWRIGKTGAALKELLAVKLMTLHETPKGRKQWVMLTDLGKATVPLIAERDAQQKKLEAQKDEEHRKEAALRKYASHLRDSLESIHAIARGDLPVERRDANPYVDRVKAILEISGPTLDMLKREGA